MIEFAFAVPIMIMLLYYIHDLVRLKRWQSQMQFVGHQIASMLQNISQNRTNKSITKDDIKYIMSAAYLTIFPGTTQFVRGWTSADLGYTPMIWVCYVKGNSDSTASVVWIQRYYSANGGYSPLEIQSDNNVIASNITSAQNVPPSQIFQSLKIEPGEHKIIIMCVLHYYDGAGSGYKFTDGRLCENVSPNSAFGFYVLPFVAKATTDGRNNSRHFHTSVIFSPRPGLFSETAPQ